MRNYKMGFCLFGVVGDCADKVESKKTAEFQMTAIRNYFSEKVNREVFKMRASSRNVQKISCFVAGGGSCVIDQVRMRQVAELSHEAVLNLRRNLSGENLVEDAVDIAAKAALDYENRSGGYNRQTLIKSEKKITETVKTEMKSLVTNDTLAECAVDTFQAQSVEARVEGGGDATIRLIDMEQSSRAAVNCMMDALVNAATLTAQSRKVSAAVEEHDRIVKTSAAPEAARALIYGGIAVTAGIVLLLAVLFWPKGRKRKRGNKN